MSLKSSEEVVSTGRITYQTTTPICTLGPEGTDSHFLAQKLSHTVYLFPSFSDSLAYAMRENCFALIPCGYQKMDNMKLEDSWVNLNFRNSESAEIKDILLSYTKPMCIAQNRNFSGGEKFCCLHPATYAFSQKFLPGIPMVFVNNKPEVVRLTFEKGFSYCIGSVDVVLKYPSLKIIKTFQPQMVWALHAKKGTL